MVRLPRLVIVVVIVCSTFLAASASAQVVMSELPLLPGATASSGGGINNAGVVSGAMTFPTAPTGRAVVWQAGGAIELPRACTDCNSSATDINDAGDVSGSVVIAGSGRAALWSNGAVTVMPLMAGQVSSTAVAINSDRVMVGWATLTDGTSRPMRWENGVGVDIGVTANVFSGNAFGINDAGDVVGAVTPSPGTGSLPFVWRSGVLSYLPVPPLNCNGTTSSGAGGAQSANENGVIVGGVAGCNGGFAAVWENGILRTLPMPPSPPFTQLPAVVASALDVNEGGDVIGYGPFPFGAATLWRRDGAVIPFESMTPGMFSPNTAANDINDSGIALGVNRAGGNRAVTWYVNTPPTLNVPANALAQAQSADGAVVTYVTTASDEHDGALVPSCAPASGAMFLPGITTVTCGATDSAGVSTTASFVVTVRIDDLLAQLTASAATIASLQSQLTTANATVASLQAAVTQVSNSIELIRTELATTLRQPSFTVPGATPQQKSAALSQAIQGLNPLSQLELFLRLGGRLRR